MSSQINQELLTSVSQSVYVITTAPTEANTSGRYILCLLTSEPATKYEGYIYLITEE